MGLYDNTVEVARRCMVLFFVVDTSGSMAGTKIGAVNQAIAEVVPEIAKLSSENADAEIKIAAMKFDDAAEWITSQPVEAEKFQWNDLDVGGGTYLGEACRALGEKLSRNAFMQEATGSYAPAIFLMSDGEPLDDYQKELAKLKENRWFQKAIKVAIAIGNGADKNVLAEFTGTTERVLEAHSPEVLMKLIKFVSVRASQIGSKSTNTLPIGKTDSIPSKQEDFTTGLQADAIQAVGGSIAGDEDF